MGTVNNLQAPVVDQSQGHTYIVQDGGTVKNVYGAVVSQGVPETSTKPTASRPHLRCPAPSVHYIERKGIENHMLTYFFGTRRGPKRYVLHGLSGAGKTELVKAFVHRHYYDIAKPEKRRFSNVFWVDATSIQTIRESLQDIAQAKGIEVHDVLTWFANRDGADQNWIILFNNADNPDLDLCTYFPDCSHGNILITTRSGEARRYGVGPGSTCAVGSMTEDESQKLLVSHLQLDDSRSSSITDDIADLAQELGHFPLSLGQAGAFIANTHLTPKKYSIMLQTRREQLLAEQDRVKSPDKYKYTSIHAAWSINFERLSPQAKQLLWFCAFLHHDDIRQTIFEYMCTGLNFYEDRYSRLLTEAERSAITQLKGFREALLADGSWNEFRFLKLIIELQSYSLVAFVPERASWFIHPLVHQWARNILNEEQQIAVRQQVFILLGSARGRAREEHVFDGLLAPHLDEVLRGTALEFDGCRNEFAFIYREVRRWDDEVIFRIGYRAGCERILGEEDDLTLESISELATTYWHQERPDDAATLQFLVMEVRKRRFGDDHLDTLKSKSSLAVTYLKQGRLDDAAALQLEVMEVLKMKLGEDHHDTLQSMAHLAVTYWKQGQLNGAVALELQVMETRKRKLGDDHLDTLRSMTNLALTYRKQGRFNDAVALQLEVMKVQERKLGGDHLDTLKSMTNLVFTYCKQGRLEDAAALQWEVLEVLKIKLGEDHLDTLESITNLAAIYYNQGFIEKAAKLELRVVQGLTKKLGTDHPDTKAAIHVLKKTRRVIKLTAWYRKLLRRIKTLLKRAPKL